MKNKKIVIIGGSGFIGRTLARRWESENRVVVLGRREPNWAAEIDGSDLVVNLAGKSVNCRYTKRNRREILASRVQSTTAAGAAIRSATVPPKLWVNMSSATIYRYAEDRPQDEYTGEMENDFSVQVCKRWEEALFSQRTPFTRKVAIRTAITLGQGGALQPLARMVRWGFGGRLGSGRQMCSWVHIDDIGRAVEWLFEHPDMEGVFNVAAPGPVSNAAFMAALRHSLGHRFGIPSPAWALKLGAALIRTETELLLKSRWVVPTRLEKAGFDFSYPTLENALENVLGHVNHY